jgi:hypothetical protein
MGSSFAMGDGSQQQNATINHSIHGECIIRSKRVLSYIMSSSDSNCLFAAAPSRVIKDTAVIVHEKTLSCEAKKVLVENYNRLSALYTLCIGLQTMTDDGATKPLLDFDESTLESEKERYQAVG